MKLCGIPFLLLLILAGCKPADSADRIVLHVGNWGGAKEGNEYDKTVDQIYRDFEKQNPGIEVKEESIPDEYVAKVSLAFIAKSEPDVLMLDASSSALFINSGIVTDLSPYIAADKSFDLNAYYPNVVDIARRGKALYAIPQDFTPMVVYYNRKLFDQAGVPYPRADWDFETFRKVAKKLTIPGASPNDPPKQYGFAFTNWCAGWVMWLWNNGANHVAPDGTHVTGFLNSPKAVEAVDFLRKLIVEDKSAPSLSQSAAMGVDLFANGQAAMVVMGHWAMVPYKASTKIKWEDLGVVALPHNIPQSQTVMYESGYAIGAHSKHKEAAWKFIKYMTSHDVQAKYQASGIAVCGRKDVAEERAKQSPLEAQFIPIIPSARPPYGSRIEGYDFVEEQMQKAMDSILQNGRQTQAALDKAAQRIDREFLKK